MQSWLWCNQRNDGLNQKHYFYTYYQYIAVRQQELLHKIHCCYTVIIITIVSTLYTSGFQPVVLVPLAVRRNLVGGKQSNFSISGKKEILTKIYLKISWLMH